MVALGDSHVSHLLLITVAELVDTLHWHDMASTYLCNICQDSYPIVNLRSLPCGEQHVSYYSGLHHNRTQHRPHKLREVHRNIYRSESVDERNVPLSQLSQSLQSCTIPPNFPRARRLGFAGSCCRLGTRLSSGLSAQADRVRSPGAHTGGGRSAAPDGATRRAGDGEGV